MKAPWFPQTTGYRSWPDTLRRRYRRTAIPVLAIFAAQFMCITVPAVLDLKIVAAKTATTILGIGVAAMIVIVAVQAVSFFRLRRFVRLHGHVVCPHCEYPLAGLTGSIDCPECGRTADIADVRRQWLAVFPGPQDGPSGAKP